MLKFYSQLVQMLPMEDTHFIAKLHTAGLFSGNKKAEVESLSTRAKKVNYFMDYVILPGLPNDRTNLGKLLKVMEKFNDDTLKNLSEQIQKALSNHH